MANRRTGRNLIRARIERLGIATVKRYLPDLPDQGDRLMLDSCLCGASQDRLAGDFGQSQASISYALTVSLRRIEWLAGPGSLFTAREIKPALKRYPFTSLEIRALVSYWQTTCYTGVKLQLGCAYSTAHDSVTAGLKKLKALAPKHIALRRFLEGFSSLRGGGFKPRWRQPPPVWNKRPRR